MFVKGRIAVTADGVIDEKDITAATDVIFIHPKMSYGVRQRVIGSAVRVKMKTSAKGKQQAAGADDMELDVGAHQIALLVHNIIAWQGPSFAGVACTPANKELLDFDEPIVQQVLTEIGMRNKTKVDDEGETTAELDDPNVIEGVVKVG